MHPDLMNKIIQMQQTPNIVQDGDELWILMGTDQHTTWPISVWSDYQQALEEKGKLQKEYTKRDVRFSLNRVKLNVA